MRSAARSGARPWRLLLAAAALMGGAPASADLIRCSQGGIERSIEVVYTQPGSAVPCEVVYRKPAAGVTDVLWRADHQAGYCEARAGELAATLREAGWQCDAGEMPAAVPASTEPVDLNDALLEPELVEVD